MRRLLPAVLACLLLAGCGKGPDFLNGPTAMSALQTGSSIAGPLPEAWELDLLAESPDMHAAFYKIAQGSTSETQYILRWGDDLLAFDETCLSGNDPQFLDFEGEGDQQDALILLCPQSACVDLHLIKRTDSGLLDQCFVGRIMEAVGQDWYALSVLDYEAASSGFAAEGELQKISSRETGQAQIETLGTFSGRLSYEDERFTLLDIQLDN